MKKIHGGSVVLLWVAIAVMPIQGATKVEVVERGPHYNVVRVKGEDRPKGLPEALGAGFGRDRDYTELGNGLNHLENGEWVPSNSEFTAYQQGIAALRGQTKVVISHDLNAPNGSVDLRAANGVRMRSSIFGIAYFDTMSGESVLIAQRGESQALLMPPNQVVFLDALTGDVAADIRYTYEIGHFEQDVVLRENPPSPTEYGLNPETTLLEVWTEFAQAPSPRKKDRVVRSVATKNRGRFAEPDQVDELLNFGPVQMSEGRAFSLNHPSQTPAGERGKSVSTIKRWLDAGERGRFLVESVSYWEIRKDLSELPNGRMNAQHLPANGREQMLVELERSRPSRIDAVADPDWEREWAAAVQSTNTLIASAAEFTQRPGYVVDYIAVNAGASDFVFETGKTYFISAPFTVSGDSVLEGGAVVKYGDEGYLAVNGALAFPNDEYRPVVFTSMHDDTIGQTIDGSSDDPQKGDYSVALRYGTPAGLIQEIRNARFRYASTALESVYWYVDLHVWHSQFLHCGVAVKNQATMDVHMYNVLAAGCDYLVEGGNSANLLDAQHVTADGLTALFTEFAGGEARLSNSLLINLREIPGLNYGVGNHLSYQGSSPDIHRTAFSGNYYLPKSSPYRDAATGAVTSRLRTELGRMTTTSPNELTGFVGNDLSLSPVVSPDDDGTLDMGYHYPRVDYVMEDITVEREVVLSLTGGVSILMHGGQGLDLRGMIKSHGTAEVLNRISQVAAVQEQPSAVGPFIELSNSDGLGRMEFAFTEFNLALGQAGLLYQDSWDEAFLSLSIRDSALYGLTVNAFPDWDSSAASVTVDLVNNIIVRSHVFLGHGYYNPDTDMSVGVYNNLFRGGSLRFYYEYGMVNPVWNVRDNLFDETTQSVSGPDMGYVSRSHNAYMSGTLNALGGVANREAIPRGYEAGPLGEYYIPVDTYLNQLHEMGSRSVGEAGLVHHTVEAYGARDSGEVDIGFHYVATVAAPAADHRIISFDQAELFSYGGTGGDVYPNEYVISDDGTQLKLSRNNWKAVPLGYQLTGSTDPQLATTFTYWFKSDGSIPEIQGVGFDTDLTPSSAWAYQNFGSETWGKQTYNDYSVGEGWRRYAVHVSSARDAGFRDYLVFINDDDAAASANAYFRNVRVGQGPGPYLGDVAIDADGDMLPDHAEDANGNGVLDAGESAVGDVDTDGDGIPDGVERLQLGMDPSNPDTDGDGIPDNLEDTDGDGLTDVSELELGLNPANRDSDGDGLIDSEEDHDGNGIVNRLQLVMDEWAIAYSSRDKAYEAGTTGEIVVRLPTPASAGTELQFYLGGGAVPGKHYTISPDTNPLPLNPGQDEVRFTVTMVSDHLGEDWRRSVEFRILEVGEQPVYSTVARVELVDNDPPEVNVFAVPVKTSEPDGETPEPAQFQFVRRGSTKTPMTVYYTLGGTASNHYDFEWINATTVTIPAGSRSASIEVVPKSDEEVEGDETVKVTLNANPHYSLDTPIPSATITIEDNPPPEPLPIVSVTTPTPEAQRAREAGTDVGWFRIKRSGNLQKPLRVFYKLGGTAVTGRSNPSTLDDYSLGVYVGSHFEPLEGFVDFGVGQSEFDAYVLPFNDTESEILETAVMVLSRGDYAVGEENMATVTIDDDEPTRYVVEGVRKIGLYGPNCNQRMELRVTRYGAAAAPVQLPMTVSYDFAGSTSLTQWILRGDGYPELNRKDSGPARIALGAWSSVAEISIQVYWNNNSDNGVRRLDCTISRPNGLLLSVPELLCAYQSSGIQLSSTPLTIPEGSTAGFVVSRPHADPTRRPRRDVLLSLWGSAGYGNTRDYLINGTGGLPVEAELALGSASTTFSVTALNDGVLEGYEMGVIQLNPNAGPTQVPIIGSDRTYFRIQDAQLTPDTELDADTDGDLLPDQFEISNVAMGLSPTEPNEYWLDVDRDGATFVEEYYARTDPAVPDPARPVMDDEDHVVVNLRVGSIGKTSRIDNNCYVCHPVGALIDGEVTMALPRSTLEKEFSLPKGDSYSIELVDPLYDLLKPEPDANADSFYTHEYTLQILGEDDGTPNFFIEDPSELLGEVKTLSTEVMDKSATVYVPRLEIAVDANRDGEVSFHPSQDDRTTAEKPYKFWLNNDSDFGFGPSADDNQGLANNRDNYILYPRDLEDFVRLHVRFSGIQTEVISENELDLVVKLSKVSGEPSLRLFPTHGHDGGLSYLTDVSMGNFQSSVGYEGLALLSHEEPTYVIPRQNWAADTGDGFRKYFLFEGVGSGDAMITFTMVSPSGETVAESEPLYLQLRSIAEFYEHWTVGDNTHRKWNEIPTEAFPTDVSATFDPPETDEEKDYILFVHGWRMTPEERRLFAETAYKRLWHAGYKGRFGMFSWPTDWMSTENWLALIANGILDNENYNVSERRAWRSGSALLDLIVRLNEQYPGRVRLIAHSMGNTVAIEALLQAKRGNLGQMVHSYAAMQAAVAAHVVDKDATPREVSYDSGTFNVYRYFWEPFSTLQESTDHWLPYYEGFTAQGGQQPARYFVNFLNPKDYALSRWQLNQDAKPLQLLYYGYQMSEGFYRRDILNRRVGLFIRPGIGDAHEIFSHIAEARCFAFGASGSVGGPFVGAEVNLEAEFGFTNEQYDHSGQFNSTIHHRLAFWERMISELGLGGL